MAVSALSLARQHRSKSIDALQHYHQAFPSLQIALRNTNDLCSDGLFLTHFLLLVYEVGDIVIVYTLCFLLIECRSLLPKRPDRIYGPITWPG